MRESLLTIPINEVFEPKCGCPICRMRDTVEEQISEYIMGAAMMEPDVRIETNRLGFCSTHYGMLLGQQNRLSLALMLNSHLAEKRQDIFEKKGLFSAKTKQKKAAQLEDTCFVCEKVDWGINHMLETFFTMFKKDSGFRKLLSEQEYFCVPHYNMLLSLAETKLPKPEQAEFKKLMDKIISDYAASLNQDVDDFCTSFDYRNKDRLKEANTEHIKEAVERSILFLTGRPAVPIRKK